MSLQLFIAVFFFMVTLFSGVLTFCTCSENKPEIYEKIEKHSIKIQFGIIIALIGTTLISLFTPLNSCSMLLFCFMICAIVFAVFSILKWVIPEKYQNILCFSAKAVVVVLLLEVSIFNFNSYDMLSHDYKEKVLDISSASYTEGLTINSDGSFTLSDGSFEFENIGIPVGSIGFDIVNDNTAEAEIRVKYADETNAEYRAEPVKAKIVNHNVSSSTVPCAFSGNVSKLMFTYNGGAENPITIKGITLNNEIKPNINPIRLFSILFIALLVYVLLNAEVFKRSVKNSYANLQLATAVLSVVFVLTAFSSIAIYRFNNQATLKEEFSMTTGNQITKELVDAFENGKVELEIPVDDSLKALNNPYDWSERVSSRASYSWDHLYYNDSYYSYYGIAPVILLFLPYHRITGFYFPTVWAVMLFGGIGIVFLIKLLNSVFKRYFPNVPFGFTIMAQIIILASSGVWFNFVTPNFYEIAQTSGFACVTAGGYFLITSNITGKGGKLSLWRLALSSSLLALGVLCRPTLAVYCIASLLFIAFGFIRLKANIKKSDKAKVQYLNYFLCALLPFVVIGLVQMIYNYVRFGSFFDFGIDYSLTINDFTRAESHISQILIGFVNFLFVAPLVDTAYPFVHSSFTTLDTNGYYFVANRVACGLIFKALPILSYLFVGRAYRLSDKKERRWNTAFILAVCIIAPFIIIYSIAESGYGVRYATDFAWQIILGAFVISFTIYSSIKNEAVRKILGYSLAFAFVVSIVINSAQLYEYQFNNAGTVDTKIMLLNISRNFEFWR